MEKSPDAFRTISEAAEELDLPQHVLRFWETRFPSIKPLKRGGGRRYYRPEDVQLLKGIRHLLYDQGFTIKGVQRILKERGPRNVIAIADGRPMEPFVPLEEEAPEDIAHIEPVLDEDAIVADDHQTPAVVAPVLKPQGAPAKSAPATAMRVLDADDRKKLEQVLRDLLDCKRLLERAREG